MYKECSISNAALLQLFISFGSINVTTQTCCILVFICLEELREELHSRCPVPHRTDTSCVSKGYQSVLCFIRYFVFRISITKCSTNSSRQVRWEVILENEHVPLVNTPRSHPPSFCATGVSSSLATMVFLNGVTRTKLSLLHGGVPTSISFCTVLRYC
jgi:hypothetical protein